MDYETDLYIALAVMLFIILDFVTGIIKAACAKNLSSTVMRQGLMHKLAFILALLLGWLCEWTMPIIGLPDVFGAVYIAVGVYIVLTEIVSILENLGEINPELKTSKFLSIFGENEESNNEEELEK